MRDARSAFNFLSTAEVSPLATNEWLGSHCSLEELAGGVFVSVFELFIRRGELFSVSVSSVRGTFDRGDPFANALRFVSDLCDEGDLRSA